MSKLNLPLIALTLVLFSQCRSSVQDIKTINSYLGTDLDSIRDLHIYKYEIIESKLEYKDIYSRFNYNSPDRLIKRLNLLHSVDSLNNDTLRTEDYLFAKLTENF